MNYLTKLDEYKLKIFHESRKRRILVGELIYDKEKDQYELIYDKNYAHSKNAIPISPDLDLFKLRHRSDKGKLFPAFIDRIPDKSNPAYNDYCKAQRISPSEKNPIILLGTIGKRGPSSFVFEPVYDSKFDSRDIIILREKLKITQHDLAKAFDISQTTLQRIEAGVSNDLNTLKYMQILMKFPEVALWQLIQTGNQVHKDVSTKLQKYFQEKADNIPLIKSFLLSSYQEYLAIANTRKLPEHGSFQVAFAIKDSIKKIVINETLLQLINSKNPRFSGWPLWIVLQNSSEEDNRPQHYADRWQSFIETSNTLDFWIITEMKRFYHYRALKDDLNGSTTAYAKAAKLKEIDFVWQIENICDAISTGIALTQALNAEEIILSFAFKWTGLQNRFLTSWAHPERVIDCKSKSNVDDIMYEINVPINATKENIIDFTYAIASYLFLTFGGYDRIARNTIEEIVINYLKWK